MNIKTFELERWQSTWENEVKLNLSESGVHPLKLSEILDTRDPEFVDRTLGYSQTNGTPELRKAVASIHNNASQDHVLITNGSSEATFLTMWSFLSPGIETIMMMPNYLGAWGLAKSFGAKVKPFWLRQSKDSWIVDLSQLRKAVTNKTKLITVCNPNNPTGAIIPEDTISEICEIAKKVRAWILVDEVYRGTELNSDEETPSSWGTYDKIIVTGGLSKAYGLPGLRIGWLIANKDQAAKLWSFKDYTTIAPTNLGDMLATKVLEPAMRKKILSRTRDILRANLPVVEQWINRNKKFVSFVPPSAGAIAFIKYNDAISNLRSMDFASKLLEQNQTLISPGEHFGLDRYFRIGYGSTRDYLEEGLDRISKFMESIAL
jgi:aspartate/methionine/tyrosine aminotransferase